MFFQRYAKLAKELPDIQARDLNMEYCDIKTTVSDYQMAKKELFGAFQREDFGTWLKKPIEQDQFVLIDHTKWLVLAAATITGDVAAAAATAAPTTTTTSMNYNYKKLNYNKNNNSTKSLLIFSE